MIPSQVTAREPEQERCDHNETEIHPQESTSDSFEREEGGRENDEIELKTGIEKDNKEVDHVVAVPVPPIVIHDLESQIDSNINTGTVNISSSICLYLIFFL